MFAATRVMAAGKAGLESLPHFVDECIVQGIPLLAPWAADHSYEQLSRLRDITRSRRKNTWRNINYIGDAELGFPIQQNTEPNRRLLHRLNPQAANSIQLADNPAQLAAWCRLNLEEHCRDTLAMWDRFKYENGISDGQQLAVVIPFCPEGPTSGTIGMYLGAALRNYFRVAERAGELVVWGIELCPPLEARDSGPLDQTAIQHAFRGYIARQELLNGLPLSENPEDKNYQEPFDITIAFDGGRTLTPTTEYEDIWEGLDRAAAQSIACLINGAAADDVAESTTLLAQGKRWNTHLVHVLSQLDYDPHCRYLPYHRSLPWYRAPEEWGSAPIGQQRDAFLRRTDEMRAWVQNEPNEIVAEKVETLLTRADELRSVKEERFLGIFRKRREADERRRQILNFALDEDQEASDALADLNAPPGNVVPKLDPFCINISLPVNMRYQAADRMREGGIQILLVDLLGDSGTYQVRGRISESLTGVLRRSDCASPEIDSQAKFKSLIAISIEDRGSGRNNDALRPSQAFLQDFIDAEDREVPGSLNLRTYDLGQRVEAPQVNSSSTDRTNKTLGWQPPKDVSFDVTVEYSLLTLARCRPEDGFTDISTHDELKQQHDALVADETRWKEFARYYSVQLPDELRVDTHR